jgi:hypothetical protein
MFDLFNLVSDDCVVSTASTCNTAGIEIAGGAETSGNKLIHGNRPYVRYCNVMSAMSQTPHILLVEDDREIRTLVTRFLQGNDMRVSAVGGGRDMDRLLRDNRIDLVVLDVMLPGDDGLEICRRVRSSSDLPVIMMHQDGSQYQMFFGVIFLLSDP